MNDYRPIPYGGIQICNAALDVLGYTDDSVAVAAEAVDLLVVVTVVGLRPRNGADPITQRGDDAVRDEVVRHEDDAGRAALEV